ncbi:threonyl-tRNA synthetase [Vibrio parahaemolyticus]|uniref:threonyl-tRNA synthetase n=1 Tax=Vibrio parahaemolyticus TaxID=670 RepID=UPI001864CEF1|nr:threonyl-tRNA synthetase [Vibrio parahaemolyticus]EII3133430.1 threonyl-tRNA synthetase [Vibrio parahaemolyticus]EJC7092307.1 threonyl-tRNA synthetase [Vibrio parahaemolyticus]EJF9948897.1 threonyl-tRNA synthetase [Vibrio parahaemolyticus]EJG0007490.1 threonyl-tRNA synthetase [Vibrio parahaemolyticus]EJG0065861.1 threonyl-tRNA synthetase [Vibrio parahaemolyticus]
MDKVIFIPSAVLGLVFVAIYAFNCYRNKKRFNHQVMVNSILQASGIVCGALLILSTFFVDLKQYLTNIDIYILISGLAVLVVSVQSVYSDLFTSYDRKETDEKKPYQVDSA